MADDTIPVSAEQARWHRLRRCGLVTPFASPEAVARALFGVQAQITSAARLALWHRCGSPPSGGRLSGGLEIEAAIEEHRTLVRAWGQRGTLHLYAADDWPVVCAATAARTIGSHEKMIRRLEAKDGSRTMASLEAARALALEILERAPDHRVSKDDLAREGDEAMARGSYGALLSLCLEGHGFRVDSGDAGAAVLGWRPKLLPDLPWQPPAFESAMIEAARRFFSTYGPAREADFRYWLSASAAETKPVVAALRDAGELVEVAVDDGSGSVIQLVTRDELPALLESPPPPSKWPVRLLGRFDPLILAHADKGCWVQPEHYKRVWHHTHVEAVFLVHGRIRGVWRTKRLTRGLKIQLQVFGKPLPVYAERAVGRQAEAVAGFSGVPLLGLKTSVVG